MVKSLELHEFTAFADVQMEFAPGLNVVVGENGTGKTHLLKLLYTVLASLGPNGGGVEPSARALEVRLTDKLVNVFRPDGLGRLVRRRLGRQRADVRAEFDATQHDIGFHFSTNSKMVQIGRVPQDWLAARPVFIPPRELLSLYPGFISLYEQHYLDFEETWRDTCVLLGAPAVRGRREPWVSGVVAPLETAMGGTLETDANGQFYLRTEQGRFEMPLVAEGLRKLAMLARLTMTGALAGHAYLLWDEPEAHLNPRLLKVAAQAVIELAQAGVQVWLATHSLFLMRELHILLQQPACRGQRARFFGLHAGPWGVEVAQGGCIDDIGDIASLDEQISQSERYLEASADDAGCH